MIPKNIIHDKEKLYDDKLKLKQTINYLTQENFQLKAKIQNMHEEMNRKNKMLNTVMSQVGNPKNSKRVQKMQREVIFVIKIDPFDRCVKKANKIIRKEFE